MKAKIIAVLIMMLFIGTTIPIIQGNIVKNDNIINSINNEYVPGQFIVKFKENIKISNPSISTLNEKYKVISINKVFLNSEGSVLDNIYLINVPEKFDMLSIIKDYSSNPNITYAEPNFIIKDDIRIKKSNFINNDKIENLEKFPNDPDFNKQWSLHNTGQTGGNPDADIDAPEAWDIEVGSEDVIVALPDSGIDLTHPDLDQIIWINDDEIPDNEIDDDENGYIDDVNGWDFSYNDNEPDDMVGHGTLIAGIIAAETNNSIGISGICWKCKIMPIKIMNANFQRTHTNTALAIKYAADNGANIISMSLGRYYISQIEKDAIEYANETGCFQLCAVGNDNIDQPEDYPPAYECVLAVGSTNENDERCDEDDWGPGEGSNFGEILDVAAPGNDIYSTMPTYHVLFNDWGKNQNYDDVYGNSFAAPHVAGVAALLLSQDPSLTKDDLWNIICANVDPYISEEYIGTGRINAYKALIRFNQPPTAPTIEGETNGEVGKEYTYEFSSTDSNGDNIGIYIVNWGDGTPAEIITGPFPSGEKAEASYTYESGGDFTITAQAEDAYGLIGPEGTLEVTMPRGKFQLFNLILERILERFPNMFPIMRQILGQ